MKRAENARNCQTDPKKVTPSSPDTATSDESVSSVGGAQTKLSLSNPPAGLPPPRKRSLRESVSSALSYPAPTPIDPLTPSLLSPRSEELEPTGSLNPNSSAPVPLPKTLHLLLVDDNKINRQLLVMFMTKCKFTFEEAENGQEALDLYRASFTSANAQRLDFVLMDISMPIMDGMEATRRIRAFEKEAGIKRTTIIALTGLASEKAREEAETSGIDVFLPKPVKFGELRKLLQREEQK